MGVLNALRRSPGALGRNPVIAIPVLALGLLQLPQLLLQATDPLLATVVSVVVSGLFVLVVPFFQGGLVAMADEALGGRTDLGTFVDSGVAHYWTLLVAYLLALAATLVVGLGLFIGAFVLGIVVLRQAALSGVALGFVGLFVGLSALAFMAVVFFIQFYSQAIVLDGEGAIDGITRSVALVRRHLLSTLGYTLVGGVVGGGVGLGLALVSVRTTPAMAPFLQFPPLSLPGIAVVWLIAIVVVTLVGSFFGIFSVAFYRELSG